MSSAADLPNNVEILKGLVRDHSRALEVADALSISQKLELEQLRFQIAVLKREIYGRSSEQLDQQLTQMHLSIEDLESGLAERPPEVRPAPKDPCREAHPSPAPSSPSARGDRSRECLQQPDLWWHVTSTGRRRQ